MLTTVLRDEMTIKVPTTALTSYKYRNDCRYHYQAYRIALVPNLFGTGFVEDNFSMDMGVRGGREEAELRW